MPVKKGVRVFANQGCASMGYDLPAAIGAHFAKKSEGRLICITGDGSIQMNLQELQTVINYNIPVKIFLLENDGYLAMKTTQRSFFDGRLTGADHTSGVVCPDMGKIANAYGIPFIRINEEAALDKTISEVLAMDGYCICEIKMPPLQTLLPKSASFMDENGKMTSAPLEKMSPFLPDDIQEQCYYKG
jgi:acetolactate synthase-1/2/3 large subunit